MNLLLGLLMTAAVAAANPSAAVERPVPMAAPEKPIATAEKMPVFLQADAQDAVGAAYVARLRQVLEGSSTYRPVTDPATARFVIGVLTMDPNEAEAGSATGNTTVASVTLQRENAPGLNEFVYSWVLVAKRDKVDALASELLAAIDAEIQGLNVPVIRFLDEAGGSH